MNWNLVDRFGEAFHTQRERKTQALKLFSFHKERRGGGVGNVDWDYTSFRKERERLSGKSWGIILERVGTGHRLLMRGMRRAGNDKGQNVRDWKHPANF